MSTEATLARHLQAFAGSVDTIMSDYVKANSPPELIPALTLLRRDIQGEIAYITWKADPFIPLATDTFVIRDGKIQAQTFALFPSNG